MLRISSSMGVQNETTWKMDHTILANFSLVDFPLPLFGCSFLSSAVVTNMSCLRDSLPTTSCIPFNPLSPASFTTASFFTNCRNFWKPLNFSLSEEPNFNDSNSAEDNTSKLKIKLDLGPTKSDKLGRLHPWARCCQELGEALASLEEKNPKCPAAQ